MYNQVGLIGIQRLLRKTAFAEDDLWLGRLNYRAAPLEGGLPPDELLIGQELRTLLPDFSVSPASPVAKHVNESTLSCT